MNEYVNETELRKLIRSKTFITLTRNDQPKTPIWQLHFSNCRFRGPSLAFVINEAIKYYSDMTNTVSK